MLSDLFLAQRDQRIDVGIHGPGVEKLYSCVDDSLVELNKAGIEGAGGLTERALRRFRTLLKNSGSRRKILVETTP